MSGGAGRPGDELPLAPGRRVDFEVEEGSWVSLDLAPDGRSLVFELLGRLYVLSARGGAAKALGGSMAFDSQPAFSPDGALIAFISDRSGAENLWISRADGADAWHLTANDTDRSLVSPAWAADGKSLFTSLYRADRNAAELWRFSLDGEGRELTGGRYSALGAAPSSDGRHLYFAATAAPLFEDHPSLPKWRIHRRDLVTGDDDIIVRHEGGAMRPALSRDGRLLAYGARRGGQTGLRLRDLKTGDDRWLAWPVEPDAQESVPTRDLLPRYAFAPDGRSLVAAFGGRIRRLPLGRGRPTIVPFRARVRRDIGPSLRRELGAETGPVRARIISDPTPSPDGERLAFSALGRVWTMELPNGVPKALTAGAPQFMPAWSPDGGQLAFVTWTARQGGAVSLGPAGGAGRPHRLTQLGPYFTDPVFRPDGRAVIALRSSQYERLTVCPEPLFTGRAFGSLRQADLVEIPLAGGAARVIASGFMGGRPQFAGREDRVLLMFDDGLNEVALDGSGRTRLIQVIGPGYYFLDGPQPVDDFLLSPDRTRLLVRHVQQLRLLKVPPLDGRTVDLDDPGLDPKRLTAVGCDFASWADNGRTVVWALGSIFHRRALADIERAPDEGLPEAKAQRFEAAVMVRRDRPASALVLRGARAVTMRRDEVIPAADVVVRGGRILGVGRSGDVEIPAGATVRDVSGLTIVPGLIDAHAHWGCVRRGVLDLESWCLAAGLAFGVTASLDPSTLTIDLLAYQDLVEAGLMLGPRIFSTGVAVFSFNRFASLEDTRAALSRYPDAYRTRNLKQYRAGNRRVRQWVAMAAAELGLMPTTEGALDMKLDLTQVIDGFAGVEHALGAAPLYEDVVRLFVETRTSHTPTLQCTHGGPPAMNAFIQASSPRDDAKLARFFPPFLRERLFARGPWADAREHAWPRVAASAATIQRAGGLVGCGSHGNVPGLGLHWEMQAYAAGGFTALEALRTATAGSAETIGRLGELGSLETGKFADLLVLRSNPLDDIAHALDIALVMKNGRLYAADTLDEVWPRPRPGPRFWFATDEPTSGPL